MVIIVLGPTAVGKTKLSIELAKKYNGEIINADSTQIYYDLNIATAKITKKEMQNIPHHLFDIKDIKDDYNVFNYQKDCRDKINEVMEKNKTPILVGGTGLYIKAALYDYDFKKEGHYDFRKYSDEKLYQKLLQVDPNSNIHPNNRKRIERALNYYYANKEPFSNKKKTDKILYDAIFIGLTTDRKLLYEKINKRVDQMVTNGLIIEAKQIYDSNIRTKAVLTPIGYKELFPYFEKKDTLDNCLNKIKQNSRKYAKRQYTFFNHQLPVKWFKVDFDDFNKTIEEVIEYIKDVKHF